VDQRRLAGAVRSQQPEELAGLDVKRDTAQRLDPRGVALDQILDLKGLVARRGGETVKRGVTAVHGGQANESSHVNRDQAGMRDPHIAGSRAVDPDTSQCGAGGEGEPVRATARTETSRRPLDYFPSRIAATTCRFACSLAAPKAVPGAKSLEPSGGGQSRRHHLHMDGAGSLTRTERSRSSWAAWSS
jgi:hypothetical protein